MQVRFLKHSGQFLTGIELIIFHVPGKFRCIIERHTAFRPQDGLIFFQITCWDTGSQGLGKVVELPQRRAIGDAGIFRQILTRDYPLIFPDFQIDRQLHTEVVHRPLHIAGLEREIHPYSVRIGFFIPLLRGDSEPDVGGVLLQKHGAVCKGLHLQGRVLRKKTADGTNGIHHRGRGFAAKFLRQVLPAFRCYPADLIRQDIQLTHARWALIMFNHAGERLLQRVTAGQPQAVKVFTAPIGDLASIHHFQLLIDALRVLGNCAPSGFGIYKGEVQAPGILSHTVILH